MELTQKEYDDFCIQYQPWIHAVERLAQKRLTEQELRTLIDKVGAVGFFQQAVIQQAIIQATDEFILSLKVDEVETPNN